LNAPVITLAYLDREHRVACIRGEILGVDSDDGGYICDVPAATYRKRLSRAQRIRDHLNAPCGLVCSPPPAWTAHEAGNAPTAASATLVESVSPVGRGSTPDRRRQSGGAQRQTTGRVDQLGVTK
jgi:hypothetical protein